MKTAFLVPSRQRPELLMESFDSVRDLFRPSEDDSFVFLVRLDEDDPLVSQTLTMGLNEPQMEFYVGPRYGYSQLHWYINELCSLTDADWLFLWNDDCEMCTPGWNNVIKEYGKDGWVFLNPDSNHNNHNTGMMLFPIVPRRFVEHLGHFSLSNHNDTWWEVIANTVGHKVDVPIRLEHKRDWIDDITKTESQQGYTTSEFYGPEIQKLIAKDAGSLDTFIQLQRFGN